MPEPYEAEEFLRREGLHNIVGATVEEVSQELFSMCSSRKSQNPENVTIFKDAINNMSRNAREVVYLIFTAPTDFVGHIWDNKDRPYLPGLRDKPRAALTKCNIRYFLHHCGWRYLDISKAFNEIGNFLKNF